MKVVMFLVLSALLASGLSAAPATPTPASASRCCFTNPRYSGMCEVMPGTDETCASILAYLNNPSGTGKTYCGGTSIRGGWASASCEAKRAATLADAPREPIGTGYALQSEGQEATSAMAGLRRSVACTQASDQR